MSVSVRSFSDGGERAGAECEDPVTPSRPVPILTAPGFGLVGEAEYCFCLSETTCASSSTDRASDYGSEGWGFESLLAHQRPALGRQGRARGVFPFQRLRLPLITRCRLSQCPRLDSPGEVPQWPPADLRPDLRRRLHGPLAIQRRIAHRRRPDHGRRHGHHDPASGRQHDSGRRQAHGRDRSPPRRTDDHPAGHPGRRRHGHCYSGQGRPPRLRHPGHRQAAPHLRIYAGPHSQALARCRGRRRPGHQPPHRHGGPR